MLCGMAVVCGYILLGAHFRERWFGGHHFLWLMPLPVLTGLLFFVLWRGLQKGREVLPFVCALLIFAMGYLGLGISLWPWVIPFAVTLEQAAAAPESLSLMLIGVAIMLPVILGYTAYAYRVFKGKISHEPLY